MHLTQQQQLNQMCPPPLGSSAAWFMNTHPPPSHPPTGLAASQTMATSYHNYHPNHNHNHQSHHNVDHHQQQNYYDINAGHSILTSPSNTSAQHSSSNTTTTTASANLAISVNNITVPQHNHIQHHQHSQHHHQQQHNQQANYTYPTYHHTQPTQQHHHQQQQQLQRAQQHQVTQQQYSSIHHHHHQQQQPLTIQQPQSQHVLHPQQPSPILQQTKPQLSPHTAQPRPSPTLLQHQQPSPNYQQHSPHLTSPSLQPSPVHHHQSQQNSPLNRHQQQTPPHHTPTPHSQHHISRPASVKEVTSTTTTSSQPSSILQTEIRILELNRKLQLRPTTSYRTSPLPSNDQYEDLKWWDEFINDFFKEDATLTLLLQIDDKPVKHILRRTFISKFFRSFFEGGATEFTINLKSSKELRGNNQSVVLECEQASIVTKNIMKHPKLSSSPRVLVCTEGRLSLEFVSNGMEPLLIKTFRFQIDHCKEFIDRSLTAIGLPNAVLMEPTTFQGLPNTTMFFLRMYSILEPMQELMTQQKLTNFEPRACLKKMLFDKFRFMSEDDKVNETKRRKRKQPSSPAVPKKSRTTISASNNPVNGIPQPTITNLPPLSIVGEPSLMGEYRDDNERLIKQIENSNHTPTEETENKPESSSEQGNQGDIENPNREMTHELEKHSSDNILATEDQVESEKEEEKVVEDTLNEVVSKDEKLEQQIEESSRPVSEGPSEKEIDEEIQTLAESQVNVMSSIPEDKEDTLSSISKLPVSSMSKSISTNGSINNKQNRRRSSERKETLREGLMRTSDFVVAMKDLKCEHPALWRITTGNNLLQQFEPKTQNGIVLYENTNQYAGWNPEIKRDYIGVDVRLTQHTRNQITVERLLLNFQKLDDAEAFYDKHFAVYLQILISTALDPRFWEGIENDTKHHDYFITSRKIIDETIKRHKLKLANKFKMSETALKNIEKYPNLLIKQIASSEESQLCQNCNTNPSTQSLSFGNKSYDLHSFKSVKVTNGPFKTDEKDLNNNLCDACLALVKLYSEVHHMGWKFYKTALKRVERQPNPVKPLNEVLDECMKDEDWLAKIYAERDSLWLRVEQTKMNSID